MSAPRLRRVGAAALLLDLDGLDEVMAWHAELIADPLPGQLEALAAASTVLLRFTDEAAVLAAPPLLAGRTPRAADARAPREVRIPVLYDGEDFAAVADLTGLSREAVVAAHTGTAWTAAFGGFAPGFAYLVGGDPRLNVPRRDTPRTAVPAGSVALAGEFSAVYPRRSPGGWQLIGRTAETMFDVDRTPPALIAPGDRVVFEAVRELAVVGDETPAERPAATPQADAASAAPDHPAALEIVAPGLLSLLQDRGRPGLGDLGVTRSGAADRPSAALANRLVGNDPDAAVIETLLGGLSVRANGTAVLALTGAVGPAAILTPTGARCPAPVRAPFALRDGETLMLDAPASGLRGYLAARGGLLAEAQLGSRSTDTLSGLGPAPLAAGQRLAVGELPAGRAVGDPETPATPLGSGTTAVVLRAVAGPRDEWFGPDGLAALQAIEWSTSAASDRVGVRLDTDGEALSRVREGELPTEPMVSGALQVPPNGRPVLFLADHPVTGGYPVIAVVIPQDLPLAAQLTPGTPVRIAIVDGDFPEGETL